MNSASLKNKIIDCRGENVQDYHQRTNSECLHMGESEESWKIKKKWILRYKKVKITVNSISKELNPHPHIDNLLISKNIYMVL